MSQNTRSKSRQFKKLVVVVLVLAAMTALSRLRQQRLFELSHVMYSHIAKGDWANARPMMEEESALVNAAPFVTE